MPSYIIKDGSSPYYFEGFENEYIARSHSWDHSQKKAFRFDSREAASKALGRMKGAQAALTNPRVLKLSGSDKSGIRFDRLLTLAAFLDNLPDEKFNFASWAGCHFNGAKSAKDCGTTACALGWATAIPEFAAEGLCLLSVRGLPPMVALDTRPIQSLYATAGESYAAIDEATKKVFGLDSEDTKQLFTPGHGLDSRSTPREVAEHLRKFVSDRGAK